MVSSIFQSTGRTDIEDRESVFGPKQPLKVCTIPEINVTIVSIVLGGTVPPGAEQGLKLC